MPLHDPLSAKPLVCESDVDLTPFNTLAVPALAKRVWRIESREQLETWYRQHAGEPFVVLGGGSNVVLAGDIEDALLLMRIPGREVVPLGDDDALITAGAGENWHALVEWTLAQGWYGLENLALIPGTVGASPIQNIGAYGVEMCQHFHSLEAFDTVEGRWITLGIDDCRFSYRHSLFKEPEGQRYIITRVNFHLSRIPALVLDYGDIRNILFQQGITAPTPVDVCEAVKTIRRQKLPDPAIEPNAGSFFKNPIVSETRYRMLLEQHPGVVSYPMPDGTFKLAAGWLIDARGWKGKHLGPVCVNQRQALVLINHGGSGRDILAAATTIADDIQRYFGVTLEMEPRVLG